MKKLKQMLKSDKSESRANPTTTSQQTPNATTSSSQPQTSQQPLSSEPAKGVLMTTNYGDITIALYSDETPKVLTYLSPQQWLQSTSAMLSTAKTTHLDLQELRHPCVHAQIRQRHLPPYHPRLHVAGRRPNRYRYRRQVDLRQ